MSTDINEVRNDGVASAALVGVLIGVAVAILALYVLTRAGASRAAAELIGGLSMFTER